MKVSFSTTVLNGFPVDIEATVERYDSSDYDHYGRYNSGRLCVAEIEIFKRGKHKSLPFIERQLTDGDWETLYQEALEAL